MTQQGDRQASIRAITGTSLPVNGDWHALFDQAGITEGAFDGRMLTWINLKLGSAYTSLPAAQQALAAANSAPSFSALGAFDASLAPSAPPAGTIGFDYSDPNQSLGLVI